MSQPTILTYINKIVEKMPEDTRRFFDGRVESFTWYNITNRDDIMLLAHATYLFSNMEHLKQVLKEHLDESPDACNNPNVKRLR